MARKCPQIIATVVHIKRVHVTNDPSITRVRSQRLCHTDRKRRVVALQARCQSRDIDAHAVNHLPPTILARLMSRLNILKPQRRAGWQGNRLSVLWVDSTSSIDSARR